MVSAYGVVFTVVLTPGRKDPPAVWERTPYGE